MLENSNMAGLWCLQGSRVSPSALCSTIFRSPQWSKMAVGASNHQGLMLDPREEDRAKTVTSFLQETLWPSTYYFHVDLIWDHLGSCPSLKREERMDAEEVRSSLCHTSVRKSLRLTREILEILLHFFLKWHWPNSAQDGRLRPCLTETSSPLCSIIYLLIKTIKVPEQSIQILATKTTYVRFPGARSF